MKFSTLIVTLASAAGVMADVHYYATCNSHIQPVGNPNSCPRKRDIFADEGLITTKRSRLTRRSYGDNAAATRKACAAYRNRHTGNKQWDSCPDCSVGVRNTNDPTYCVTVCNSPGRHIGGDEFLHYCKQAGADESDAY